MGHTLEKNIEEYIHDKGWDMDYHNGTVKSYWGGNWDVDIEKADHCFSILGMTEYRDNRIVLRQPCPDYVKSTIASSDQEVMAYTLAHELGHADTYMLSIAIPSVLIVNRIMASIEQKSLRPLAHAVAGFAACKTIVDEVLAESAAYALHSVPAGRMGYFMLPDVVDLVSSF